MRRLLIPLLAAVLPVVAIARPASAAIPTIAAFGVSRYVGPTDIAPTTQVPSTAPKVLLLGDSTMAALRWEPVSQANLAGLDYDLDVESCRTISVPSCRGREGYRPPNTIEALTELQPGAYDELVLMVGYNESYATFQQSIVALPPLLRAKGFKHVTWLTFHVAGTYQPPLGGDASYRSNNVLLDKLASESGGFVSLLDWDTFVDDRNGEYVTADGAHLTTTGAYALASFIRAGVTFLWSGAGAPVASLAREQQVTEVPVGFTFTPHPGRVLDTRTGYGAPRAGLVRQGTAVRISTRDEGVPETATTAVLNVTAVSPSAASFVTVYPCTAALPTASVLNLQRGQVRAASTIATLDADGGVCVYAQQAMHLVVDLVGFGESTGELLLGPVSPSRQLDTRTARTPLAPFVPVSVPLRLDAAGVSAVMLNVTVTAPAMAGYLSVYPTASNGTCGTPPLASSVNTGRNETIANRVNAAIGDPAHPAVCLVSSVRTDVVIDLIGTYRAGTEGAWSSTAPVRVMDTRIGLGATGQQTAFVVSVPPANAVELTLTAVEPRRDAFVTAYPSRPDATCGAAPLASAVNVMAGAVAANSVIVAAPTGRVCVFASAPMHLVADVSGRTA